MVAFLNVMSYQFTTNDERAGFSRYGFDGMQFQICDDNAMTLRQHSIFSEPKINAFYDASILYSIAYVRALRQCKGSSS
jgi:hypothetical protein